MKTVKGDLFIVPNKAFDGKVQVWATTPGNRDSNWLCHGIDDTDGNLIEDAGVFPYSLSVEVLNGKTEWDTISLNLTDDLVAELTLRQKPYRYGHFGSFEEVLAKVTA
jgi:hypothetical protein